jgi:hypothetical protein
MTTKLMKTQRRAFQTGVAWALLSLCGAASGEIIDVRWNTEQSFERTQTLAAGKVVEICEKLPSGQTVAWAFDASTALNFNLHFHVGKDVTYLEKTDAVFEKQGKLVAPSGQEFCWMWSNPSTQAAKLTVRLRKPLPSL